MAFIDRGEEEYITNVTNRFCSVRVGLEYIFEHTGLMYVIRQRDRDVETEAQATEEHRLRQAQSETGVPSATLYPDLIRTGRHRQTERQFFEGKFQTVSSSKSLP